MPGLFCEVLGLNLYRGINQPNVFRGFFKLPPGTVSISGKLRSVPSRLFPVSLPFDSDTERREITHQREKAQCGLVGM
jgi:hypothetical protein